MEAIRVLVTGAGSGVGQGIIKALRLSTLPITVIAADISPFNAGLYRADQSCLLPKVESEGSLDKIISILNLQKVQVVLVGSEFDLSFFSENRSTIESQTETIVIASPLPTVRIADDKFLTAEFLREQGLPYAESSLPKSLEEALDTSIQLGFPLVLKSRTGTSSRHVHILENAMQLRQHFATTPNPMLQAMIHRPSAQLDSEYTCSVYKCRDSTLLGPFTSRRTVRWGTSWLVEVGQFPELHPLLLKIAATLPILGSFNVQLAIGENGPVPFEFNARFSGTTAVRAHYGFNEPEFALRDSFLQEAIPAPQIGRGLAMRYIEEVFIDNLSAAELNEPLPKGVVERWF